MDAAALARDLIPRLRRWTPANWSRPATPVPTPEGGGPALSRAEAAAAVVQRLADVGADAAGEPRRVVPREADTVLADQLAVMVDDILRTGDPAAARTAAAELATLRTTLGYH
jgi:hypothetical protein